MLACRVRKVRGPVHRVLIYLGALAVVPLLVGASVSITSWMVGASLGLLGQPHWVSVSVLRLVPYVFTCVAFTLVYKLLPNCRVEWRHAVAGGLIAAVAFAWIARSFRNEAPPPAMAQREVVSIAAD